MRILVTRPARDASSLLTALAARGHRPIWSPALEMQILDGPPLAVADYQAAVITSANAVRALAARNQERMILLLCVGPASANTARDLGFQNVHAADGEGVAGLVEKLTNTLRPDHGAVLYPSAADIAGNLMAEMSAKGFKLDRKIVYKMALAERLSPDAAGALAQDTLDLVTYFSVRSVEGMRSAAENAGLLDRLREIPALCLSPAVAAAAQNTHERTQSANHATETAMLEAVDGLHVSGL